MLIYLYNELGRQCAGDNDGRERHGARYTTYGLVDGTLCHRYCCCDYLPIRH